MEHWIDDNSSQQHTTSAIMADSASELESDTSSMDGVATPKVTSHIYFEQLQKRIESLQQENRVLKMELDTCNTKCKSLREDNRELRKASVSIVSIMHLFLHIQESN